LYRIPLRSPLNSKQILLNPHFTYFIILAASLAGPLLLSFDKKVAFYKKWKYLFPAMLLPALFYVAWDIYFTAQNIWGFNENYTTGIKLFNLPVEEVLFFFVVPYCCLFIYECLQSYFPEIKNKVPANKILKILAVPLFIIGVIFYNKSYTSWTFIFLSICISIIYILKKYFKSFDASSFLITYLIILLPFLIVNGFLTAIPVVLYNDAENLGIKIFTIPFEDIFYGMLLILMNIVIYEKLKQKVTR
jgi:lycopene cyclase domain-containing protein